MGHVAIDGFPSTHWATIAAARDADPAVRRRALARVVERYFEPLRGRLLSRWNLSPDQADDLLQDFLAGPVLEDRLIEEARQEKGRFRGFLVTVLDRFASNALRDAGRLKRSPPAGNGKKREPDEIACPGARPEEAFDVAWARSVLRQALHRMHDHCLATGRETMWLLFESRVLVPTLTGRDAEGYDVLVPKLHFTDAEHAQTVLVNAKRMFTRAMRSVVSEYESDSKMIQREIDELRKILGTTRGLKDTLGFRLGGDGGK